MIWVQIAVLSLTTHVTLEQINLFGPQFFIHKMRTIVLELQFPF